MLSLDLPQNPSSSEFTQTTRVLVVEDEYLIQEMIAIALQEEGYKVTTASDGRTAVSLLQLNDPSAEFPFDLIVLDLMLPQVNGLDICRLLRYQH
ncbi:MAG: response regulator, partial [Chroococcales cyanobacterium]